MVEYSVPMDDIFTALADPTRRDILSRLLHNDLNVSKLAESYDMSLAAVSKHLKILERATLVKKRKRGKEHIISIRPEAIMQAGTYLKQYEQLWNERFDILEELLKEG